MLEYKVTTGETKGASFSLEDWAKDREARDEALETLLDLCESDPDVNLTMREYDATRDTLKEIYTEFIKSGSGQWVKGHFVAASALAYAPSLAYCLKARAKGAPTKEEVSYAMIRYFQVGSLPDFELGHI
jgi:hypothetical protein